MENPRCVGKIKMLPMYFPDLSMFTLMSRFRLSTKRGTVGKQLTFSIVRDFPLISCSAVVMFVVQPVEVNLYDQKLLEYHVIER